jgi:uncharacterized membrane protein YkgB
MRVFDTLFISWMRRYGIFLLRIALGTVFIWFGALKIFGMSPVADLIANTYAFLPQAALLCALGIAEILIGIGLVAKIALRVTLGLLWIQMAGTLIAIPLSPALFFMGNNPFLLTAAGEFIVKNFVLIAAGMVIGGYEVQPLKNRA